MGICFSSLDALDTDHAITFAEENHATTFVEENIYFPCKEGSAATKFELRNTQNSISDFHSNSSCPGKELSFPFSVDCTETRHHDVDSSGTKNPSSQQASVGESANERRYKLIDLLDKAQLVTTKRSPSRLCPLTKSSRKGSSTGTGIGLFRDCREDDAIPNRSKFIPLIVKKIVENLDPLTKNMRRRNVSKHQQIEAPLHSCSQLVRKSKALPPMSNIDQKSNISTKIAPALTEDFNERSNLNGGLGIFGCDGSGKVEEVDFPALKIHPLKSCEIRGFEFQESAKGRCSLSMDSEKAFGSPFSVESNNLCEEEKRREYLESLTTDEMRDSSSDLFDIDFRKGERVAGMAFSTV